MQKHSADAAAGPQLNNRDSANSVKDKEGKEYLCPMRRVQWVS